MALAWRWNGVGLVVKWRWLAVNGVGPAVEWRWLALVLTRVEHPVAQSPLERRLAPHLRTTRKGSDLAAKAAETQGKGSVLATKAAETQGKGGALATPRTRPRPPRRPPAPAAGRPRTRTPPRICGTEEAQEGGQTQHRRAGGHPLVTANRRRVAANRRRVAANRRRFYRQPTPTNRRWSPS